MATLKRRTIYKTGGASYSQDGVKASVYVGPKMFSGPAPETIEFGAENLASPNTDAVAKTEAKAAKAAEREAAKAAKATEREAAKAKKAAERQAAKEETAKKREAAKLEREAAKAARATAAAEAAKAAGAAQPSA